MRLTLIKPFISIVGMEPTDLPDLTVITGLNGSGKSQLLRAIQSGSIACDIAIRPEQDIRLFDWTNVAPRDEGDFASETILNEQLALFIHFEQQLTMHWGFQRLFDVAVQGGLTGAILLSASAILNATVADIADITGNPVSAPGLASVFDQVATQFEDIYLPLLQPAQKALALHIAKNAGCRIMALEKKHFLMTHKPSWGTTDIFQHSFARLFVAYRNLHLSNKVRQVARASGREDVVFETDAEFIAHYGPPPWEFVNDVLEASQTSFTIDSPDEFGQTSYRPVLRKKGSPAESCFPIYHRAKRSSCRLPLWYTILQMPGNNCYGPNCCC